MTLNDIVNWQPPAPGEQIQGVVQIHSDELIIVTTFAIYKVVDREPPERFSVSLLVRI